MSVRRSASGDGRQAVLAQSASTKRSIGLRGQSAGDTSGSLRPLRSEQRPMCLVIAPRGDPGPQHFDVTGRQALARRTGGHAEIFVVAVMRLISSLSSGLPGATA